MNYNIVIQLFLATNSCLVDLNTLFLKKMCNDLLLQFTFNSRTVMLQSGSTTDNHCYVTPPSTKLVPSWLAVSEGAGLSSGDNIDLSSAWMWALLIQWHHHTILWWPQGQGNVPHTLGCSHIRCPPWPGPGSLAEEEPGQNPSALLELGDLCLIPPSGWSWLVLSLPFCHYWTSAWYEITSLNPFTNGLIFIV